MSSPSLPSPPFEIAHGDPAFPFYWLTTPAILYTMTKMNEAATQFMADYIAHNSTHSDCSCNTNECDECYDRIMCEDCEENDGYRTPNIQASFKTIIRMCVEISRRAENGDADAANINYDEILKQATTFWNPEIGPPFDFNVVMELEGVPLQPI
jgi:hypothetical protein